MYDAQDAPALLPPLAPAAAVKLPGPAIVTRQEDIFDAFRSMCYEDSKWLKLKVHTLCTPHAYLDMASLMQALVCMASLP